MARSDHWRWVSIPKWARLSAKVASKLQRFMKSRTISSAACAWSVENTALGGRFPAGSRVSTQRYQHGLAGLREDAVRLLKGKDVLIVLDDIDAQLDIRAVID